MSHNETVLMLRCMDKRLLEKVVEYLRAKGLLGHCYDPAPAGAVKDLVEDENASTWKHIAIAVEKGGVKQVILCNHTDCAAYGGSSRFSHISLERNFHIEEMRKAKDLILAKYPDLQVRMVLCVISPTTREVEGFEDLSESVAA
ncbi:MAG: hypothetical protein HY443_01820 [Candidatus Nealsonbacteria bacterium]|nr:hypothetical protein [Candidatus Nealsonbacteria bacterium]